jgi:outer membrane protein assembly factor BamB
MYDAFTGNWICNIVGVPFGTQAVDANGDILIYVVNTQAGWIAEWNSTLCLLNTSPSNVTTNGYWEWRPPLGQSVPASTGYSWNITLPSQVPASAYVVGYDESTQIMLLSTGLPVFSIGEPPFPSLTAYTDMAISLNPSTLGKLLWKDPRQWPPGNVTLAVGGSIAYIDQDAYTVYVKETRQWYAYNLTTGDLMWGPSASEGQWDMYLAGVPQSATAYDTLYTCGFGGTLYAYDLTTGKVEWTFYSGNSGLSTPYGQYPIWIGAISDGMIYVYASDHANGGTPWLGAQLYCVNVTNGQLLWSLDGWFGNSAGGGGNVAISDGRIADLNTYDNQIYCMGKGPSETTLQTPLAGVTQGQGFTIQGTVMDTSAGASQTAVKANFPNGLPCVSDASMSQFMEAVYEQQPMPTNVTGVPVTLTAVDPNGNTVLLGTTTSGASGYYSLKVNTNTLAAGPGQYTVTATFAGTDSYYGSSAESGFTLNAAAPTPVPSAPPVTGLASTSTVELGVAAIIIVIVIIGIVLAVITLRKRP